MQKLKHSTIMKSRIKKNNEELLIVKPHTFMNRSNLAVTEIMQIYHLKPADIFVAFDDLDLPIGKIQISKEFLKQVQKFFKNLFDDRKNFKESSSDSDDELSPEKYQKRRSKC
jgi:peptidyl-tRNA hydrolase